MVSPRAVDPKTYYGYLFKPDKTPTKTLDALLRAVAQYIVSAGSRAQGGRKMGVWVTASGLLEQLHQSGRVDH
jgi:hypothetical protein